MKLKSKFITVLKIEPSFKKLHNIKYMLSFTSVTYRLDILDVVNV